MRDLNLRQHAGSKLDLPSHMKLYLPVIHFVLNFGKRLTKNMKDFIIVKSQNKPPLQTPKISKEQESLKQTFPGTVENKINKIKLQ